MQITIILDRTLENCGIVDQGTCAASIQVGYQMIVIERIDRGELRRFGERLR